MNDLMTTFASNDLMPYLSEEQIKHDCPVAFCTEKTNKNLTDKYKVTTTIDVVRDLDTLNWKCVSAAQKRPNKNSGRYSYHALFFQNPDVKTEDGYPRIMLTNSHDGTSSFKFGCAFYRLVCSNGLIIADKTMADLKIRHIYYEFSELRKMVNTLTGIIPLKLNTIETMKQVILDEEYRFSFAEMAFRVRVPSFAEDKSVDESILAEWLQPLRNEDSEPTLWNVFNTVQERVIKGDGHIVTLEGKIKKMKAIKSPKSDIEFNTKLWEIAQKFIK